jgi:hypothetical protein
VLGLGVNVNLPGQAWPRGFRESKAVEGILTPFVPLEAACVQTYLPNVCWVASGPGLRGERLHGISSIRRNLKWL